MDSNLVNNLKLNYFMLQISKYCVWCFETFLTYLHTLLLRIKIFTKGLIYFFYRRSLAKHVLANQKRTIIIPIFPVKEDYCRLSELTNIVEQKF